MKRVLSMLLMVCLLVPAIAISANAEVPGWAQLYVNFISAKTYADNMELEFHEGGNEPVAYALYDMDNDGVPELLINNGGESEADNCVYLYRISFGTVQFVDVAGGRIESKFRYDTEYGYPGLFYDYAGNNGMATTSYEYIESGMLKIAEITTTEDGKTTVVVDDQKLVEANEAAVNELVFTTMAEIADLGWDVFLGVSGIDAALELANEPAEEIVTYTTHKDNGKYKYVAVTANSLYVRAEPLVDSARLTSLDKGTTVAYQNKYAVDSNNMTWYCIKVGSKIGWVSGKYSKRTNDQGGGGNIKTLYVTGQSAYIRKEANKDSSIVTTVHEGDTLAYKGTHDTDSRGVKWYYVKYNNKTGWISSKMVSTKKPDPKPSGKSYIYVTANAANVRAEADTDSKSLGTVHEGDKLVYKKKTATDYRGVKWYCVEYKSKTGWISSKMASPNKNDPTPVGTKMVTVTGSSSNLRAAADKDSKSVAVVHEGDKLYYLGKSSTDSRGVKWYKVQTKNGKTGWISSKMASKPK